LSYFYFTKWLDLAVVSYLDFVVCIQGFAETTIFGMPLTIFQKVLRNLGFQYLVLVAVVLSVLQVVLVE